MNILHAGGQFIARPRVSGWAVYVEVATYFTDLEICQKTCG